MQPQVAKKPSMVGGFATVLFAMMGV